MSYTSNFLTFLADADRVEKWLFEVGYYDPSTQAEGTLYFSSHAYANGSQAYLARILPDGLSFETSALGAAALIGAPGLADVPKAGVLKVGQVNGDLDYIKGKGYVFAGRTGTLKLGGYSRRLGGELAHADYGVMRVADVGNVLATDTEVSFELRDPGEVLKKPLQTRRFSGSDWSIRCTSAAGAYITFGAPAACNLTGALAIAAKIRPKTISNTGGILNWRISTTTTFPFGFGFNSSGQLYLSATGMTTVASTATLTADTEYLVCVSVIGNVYYFHIFDLFAGTTTTETGTLSISVRSGHVGGDLRINHNNGTNSTDTIYDWVALWNAFKDVNFFADLANRQQTTLEAAAGDLVLLARMEEGSGTTTADASASALTGTFGGTPTWLLSLGGGSQLEGQVKPDCWGAYTRMSPALVWPLTQIYCVSGAKTNSVLELHEGGLTMTAGTGYTDQETFLAASTTAARYDTLIWAGGTYVRLGSTPSKPITVTGRGNLNPAGSYVNTVDGIAKAICEARAGVTSSLAGINTGSAAVVQYVATDEVSCEDALAALFSSVGAIGYWGRQDGLMMAKVLSEDPTVAVAATLDVRSIETAEPVSLDQPVNLVKVRYARNYTPLSVDQQSASVTGTATQLVVEYPWKTTSFPITNRNNRARTLDRETCLTSLADAQAAAKREGQLFGRAPRAFDVVADLRGAVVDFGDRVNVRLTDPGADGVPLVRLDLGHGGAEKTGFCLSLNGTSDTISLGSSASYAITTFTVEGWFNASASGTGFRVLCERQNTSANRNWWLALWDGSAGRPLGCLVAQWSIGTTAVHFLRTEYSVADGQWHHVALTMNGTTACLYLDGVLVATRASGGTVDNPASSAVYLGSEEGSSRWFGGYMRGWRIWSVVRTAAQIWTYRKQTETSPSGLLAELRLDEMRGTAVLNRGSVGGQLTLTGGTWAESYGYTPMIVLAGGEASGGERTFGRSKLTLWRGN